MLVSLCRLLRVILRRAITVYLCILYFHSMAVQGSYVSILLQAVQVPALSDASLADNPDDKKRGQA